jgi:DNA replication and repair protein RecF
LTPLTHRLIDGSPRDRRRFLDWSLFHVEQGYLDLWHRYHRALRQRNALLRIGDDRSLESWEHEMGGQGDRLHALRAERVKALATHFSSHAEAFDLAGATLEYDQGWHVESPLMEVLCANRKIDREAGYSSRGPHRAELHIKVEGRRAQAHWSRGQSKLAAACMALAQAGLIAQCTGSTPVLLIDDFGAELDANRREKLALLAAADRRQVIATATEAHQIPPTAAAATFHVEHGVVQKRL